jgi:hypothetical protein
MRRSKIVYFYIGTLLVAVAVCILLFVLAFQTIRRTPIAANTPAPTATVAPNSPIASNPSAILDQRYFRSFSGLITGLQNMPNKITVLNIETDRDLSYDVTGNVNIENRYGNAMAYNELRPGMILEVGFDSQSSALVSLTESTKAWELKSKSNIKIDVATSSISLGNEKYVFNSQTLVMYKDEPYPISQISSVDTVSLTGYGNDVWCVRVEGSHGFLKIENIDKVINGNITVDNSFSRAVTDVTEPVTLVEGLHSVVVQGENIKPFSVTVNIRPDQTETVSLLDVELLPGLLDIVPSEPDSTIIIDGMAVTGPGPFEVSFGEHSVRVEKDGFLPVEQTVNVSQARQSIDILLSRVVLNAKLWIATIPTPAEVYVDDEFVGNSPLSHELTVGQHTVSVRLTGYNDYTQNLNILEGENTQTLVLTPVSSDPFAQITPQPGGPIVETPVEVPPFNPYDPSTPTPVPSSTAQQTPIQTPIPTIQPIPFPTPLPTATANTGPVFNEDFDTPQGYYPPINPQATITPNEDGRPPW